MAKDGDTNPLLEQAKKIGVATEDVEADGGSEGIASFERFMTTFGAPHRWAGTG